MMAERRRTLKIFEADEEYSRTIEDIPSLAFEPPGSPAPAEPVEPVEPQVISEAPVQPRRGRADARQQARGKLDRPEKDNIPLPKPTRREPEPAVVTDTKAQVQVRPAVRPLARQHKELEALEQAGYQTETILRLARQRTQKRIKIVPTYTVADKSDQFEGKRERLHFRVPKAIVEELSEQAGDLGTLPETELMRSQYQPIWIEELDAVIAKLKGKKS
jgi:hypothetical protein